MGGHFLLQALPGLRQLLEAAAQRFRGLGLLQGILDRRAAVHSRLERGHRRRQRVHHCLVAHLGLAADDDLKVGSHSTAILFGDLDLVIQGILYALFLGAMALVGQRAELGWPYWTALGVAALMVAYEFWLCRNREREPCFKAFLHNNWVGAVLFAGILASQYLP